MRSHLITYHRTGPVFCILLGVDSGCARPITGQITSVTWPVIGWSEHTLNLLLARDRTQARVLCATHGDWSIDSNMSIIVTVTEGAIHDLLPFIIEFGFLFFWLYFDCCLLHITFYYTLGNLAMTVLCIAIYNNIPPKVPAYCTSYHSIGTNNMTIFVTKRAQQTLHQYP